MTKIRWNEKLETDRRRALVGKILVRGGNFLPTREIARRLAEHPDETQRSVNRRGQPWHHSTIAEDVQATRADWLERAASDAAAQKRWIFAQYVELLLTFWEREEYPDVRRTLRDLRAMLGTDAPQIVAHELTQFRMIEGLQRLKAHYGHDPQLLREIYGVLSGNDPAAPPKPLPN